MASRDKNPGALIETIPLPDPLQAHANAVIEAHYAGRTDGAALDAILYYLETDGFDDLLAASGDLIALNFPRFVDEYFADSALRRYTGIEAENPISDVDRLSFARERIGSMADELNDCLTPSILSCAISHPDGRRVIIGGYVEIHGQLGPETTWLGVYSSEIDFVDQLRNLELIYLTALGSITDKTILTRWHQ
jgi:hypothetical protein